MKHRSLRSIVPVLAILVLLPLAASAGRPVLLPHPDPLASPPAGVMSQVAWAPDHRVPAEKITPMLQLEAAKVPMGSPLKVIVLLVEPRGTVVSQQLVRSMDEAAQRQAVAALEHEFVAKASLAGFEARRGLVNIPAVVGEMPSDMLDEVAALPMVRAIELDFPVHAFRAEGGAMIRSPELRSAGGDGDGIGVAILDTGIDWNHPELPWGSTVVARGDFTDTQEDDVAGYDDGGHGTACAGIVAGTGAGMARKAHLWTLKVLDSEGSGSYSSVVDALDSAYTNRDNFGGLHVVNLSLGGNAPMAGTCDGTMPTMTTAMQKLVDAGIAIFVASGNDGCSDGISFPACISHAISVGAVYDASFGGVGFNEGNCTPSGCTDTSTAAFMITCYSNSGNVLDILGPSHMCQTTKMGGGYDYQFGGTSAAAPYAAGLAAQILSLRPSTTPAELRSALTATGYAVTDSRNGITRRVVDGMEAYQMLQGGGGGESGVFWVPVVVHASGDAGSRWRSDLAFLNMGSASVKPTFVIRMSGQTITAEASQPIQPGAQAMFVDLLGQLSVTGSGSLSVATDQPAMVGSRIYSEAADGSTVGQFMDGLTSADGIGAGQSAIVPQLIQGWNYRSNIGLVNMGGTTASGTIELYDDDGRLVGSYGFSVGAGKNYQDSQPFSRRFGTNVYGGYAKIVVNSGSGVWAYGSVIDGRTNDATTIPMKR